MHAWLMSHKIVVTVDLNIPLKIYGLYRANIIVLVQKLNILKLLCRFECKYIPIIAFNLSLSSQCLEIKPLRLPNISDFKSIQIISIQIIPNRFREHRRKVWLSEKIIIIFWTGSTLENVQHLQVFGNILNRFNTWKEHL